MAAETMVRAVWCAHLRPWQLDGLVTGTHDYKAVPAGAKEVPGLYGAGIGGEALVCLWPDDVGLWFKALAASLGCKGGSGCRHVPAPYFDPNGAPGGSWIIGGLPHG